jgi:ribose/xylose/arabinose/galactoside ABC-type transport system permease subunit
LGGGNFCRAVCLFWDYVLLAGTEKGRHWLAVGESERVAQQR